MGNRQIPEWFDRIPKSVGNKKLFFGDTSRYLGALNRRPGGTPVIPMPFYVSRALPFGPADTFARSKEHFQGIGRRGQYLVISGGLKHRVSQLLLVRMGTRDERGAWNLPDYPYRHTDPPIDDRIVHVESIDEDGRWHAGGIQLLEDVVGVPVYAEGSGNSCVKFFKILIRAAQWDTDDASRRWMKPLTGARLDKKTEAKAIGLTRLSSGEARGRVVLAVWDDEHLDFHISTGPDIENGFDEEFARTDRHRIRAGFAEGAQLGAGSYQNINLITDQDRLFLIGTRNENFITPTLTGDDQLDLYEVTFPNGYSEAPEVRFLRRRQMFCHNKQCNFGAAAGIYREDDNHVYLYAVYHFFLDGNKRIGFNEYSFV